MVRSVQAKVPDDVLQKDLERYRKLAVEAGATDAKIITADMVLIDERVRGKCYIPLCGSFGKTPNCPPHSPDLDLTRKIVNNFKYGIFYMLRVPSEELAGPDFKTKKTGKRSAIVHWEISAKVESAAFYDGYHLAMAFAGGPCEPYFCPDHVCTVLSHQGCPYPLRVRPSMEGVGMNAMTMAANVGWDVYPIGGSVSPSEIPYGTKLGLILVY